MRTLVILSVVLALTIAVAQAERWCYECDPESGVDCSDISNAKQNKCPPSDNFCSKIILNGEITRSCVGDRYASVGCKGTGGNVHCECDSDYCNETNTITSSMSLLLLAITSLVAKFLL